ncbi:hypothetical protein [Streptomyces tagetis]|uniref:LigA protein n=1 Tax=Streptomyces tagetis TaxID=2820809 RepID=A0A941B1U9_9ACTN|nr:hypothetical protein [Streptomyces sp. RG38]MBQ0828446.1 hypothetical protein [Streptomyces sp. RG38]
MPESRAQEPFEDRLSAALRDTGDRFDADRAALAAGGLARGHRTRLRRRAGVLGGAAGIALIGVGGALLLPGGGDSAGARQTPAAALTSSTVPSPSAAYSGDDLLRALKGLLPEGAVGQEEAQGPGPGPGLPPYARLVFDDGKGAAAVGVGLGRVEPGSREVRELTTCPDRTFVAYDACTTRRLADGSLLMVFQGYEYPDRRVDTKWWSAELVTARGQHVTVNEWNSPAEKDAPITRDRPPLSPAELEKIATADVWRRVVDAIPGEPEAGEEAGASATPSRMPEPSGEGIAEAFLSLMPEGLDVVTKGAQETGYAYLVVDDGKGRSLVQVNVQPDMRDSRDELYGDAERRPDGTLVATSQGPGEKGGAGVVMWTVDTMRTDGRRVVISAFNTGAQHQEATRQAPALTMEQLEEMALSPRWTRVR